MKLTTDLFLVTYPGDYDWLPYLFVSITNFVKRRSFRRLVIVLEEGDKDCQAIKAVCKLDGAMVKRCRSYREGPIRGYVGQQIEKMRAWQYTDAARIVVLDSDEVFCRNVDMQTDPAINIRRPLMVVRPWENAGKAQCWKEATARVLGEEPPYETLCRDPYVYPRRFLKDVWTAMGGEERLQTFDGLSEFNLMGNWAVLHRPKLFTVRVAQGTKIVDDLTCAVDDPALPPPCLKRFWSHHRVDHPDVQAEMRRLGIV